MAMDKELQEIQLRLLRNGIPVGKEGADGYWGSATAGALNAVLDKFGFPQAIPPQTSVDVSVNHAGPMNAGMVEVPALWMPAAKMARIIVHWTAGSYVCSELDIEHYHIIIDGDRKLHKGEHSIKDNETNLKEGGYAAHTLNCNTGSIGVSVCAMAGAVESPFNAGKFPLKEEQFDTLAQVVAQLCTRYNIPVSRRTVLSHAEVQPTLGITQRGKWDIARLPYNSAIVGALAVGDHLRSEVEVYLKDYS